MSYAETGGPAVEAAGLEKSYGALRVLQGVDLRVEAGTVFSLLGPNGAGKTTTVRILSTLTAPDGGRARVAGLDVVRDRSGVRRRISVTGQYAALDGLQTGEENLRMLGRLSGLDRAEARRRAAEVLERFDLTAAARRRVATYSGGMRRRLDLAASLVRRPAVLFLDEPTTGLDVRSRQALWDVIGELAGSGVTVFLTTQYLEEADQLAGRVAVMDGGRVVADGTPAQLKQGVAGGGPRQGTRLAGGGPRPGTRAGLRLDLTLTGPAAFQDVARNLDGRAVLRDPSTLTLGVATDGSAAHVRALLDELDPDGQAVERFDVHAPTLDDVFLALTGHTATHPQEEATHA